MKKLIFTAVIATMISVSAFADGGKKTSTTTGEENVSYAVLTQFQSDFENVSNTVWTVTSRSQKVNFTKNKVNYTAYYDANGEYWGLAQEIAATTVTKEVKNVLAKDYAGYDVKSVTRFEANDSEEPVVYFISLKNDKETILLTISPVDGQVTNIDRA
ncbi:hypothetical protein [Mucilaginibacter sp. dw_454]|uniref:hypothetical protein n=1 Tax=Mucilaginibacter sp. dw_454 TaxID=2720079 RepID=UPI001BD49830|nr:hypothetical protein [Mucilaginibacter sp. dw_454]